MAATIGTLDNPSTTCKGEACNKSVFNLNVQEYAALLEKEHNVTLLPPDLDTTAEDNMRACRIYDCLDPLLVLGRHRSNEITALYNALVVSTPSTSSSGSHSTTSTSFEEQEQLLERKRQALLYLLTGGHLGQNCKVDPPIQVDYGHNTVIGDNVTIGSNCVILDCAPITIGSRTILGPGVKLFGPIHHTNPLLRNPIRQFDFAMEIHIGEDCWIGAGAVLCPGVTIGDGVTVLPGSVVTKNVGGFVVVGGSPARILEVLDRKMCEKENEGDEELTYGDDDGWRPPVVETMALP
ncbi:hypothetical protein EC991_011489 [Linnemannia zychae]|nr:hypothetical protein EC991_011489 [Linnemannia zychae]